MPKNKVNVIRLNLIKDTIEDFNLYNKEYFKPCKLYYKIGNKTLKCAYCLENHPKKF